MASLPLLSLTNADKVAPYLCVLMLGISFFHPSRDIRTVRDLRRDFDALRRDFDSLSADHSATLAFLRDYDWASLCNRGSAGDAPAGAPSQAPRVANGCSYTRCFGFDGVRRGSDTWLVGDVSPWGVISSAYRGGFSTSDGALYSFFPVIDAPLGSGKEM